MFVRGFDFGTTVQQIRDHCSIVGPVSSIAMKGEGAAVVSYPSPEQAEQAVLQLNNTTISGNSRYIDVKLDGQKSSNNKRPAQFTATGTTNRVFVRGFDFGTTDEQLQLHCGSVPHLHTCTCSTCVVWFHICLSVLHMSPCVCVCARVGVQTWKSLRLVVTG